MRSLAETHVASLEPNRQEQVEDEDEPKLLVNMDTEEPEMENEDGVVMEVVESEEPDVSEDKSVHSASPARFETVKEADEKGSPRVSVRGNVYVISGGLSEIEV